jgi:hypothetical protein
MGPVKKRRSQGNAVIKVHWTGARLEPTPSKNLDPRCDAAVREFLGIDIDQGSWRPYDRHEEPLFDPWPWGF